MRFAAIVAIGLMLLPTGCNRGPKIPDSVQVSGKITIKGKPAEGAIVAFTAISGGLPGSHRYAEAKTDANGEYTIAKAYPAEYQVQVMKPGSREEPNPDQVAANPNADSPYAAYGSDTPLRAVVSKDAVRFDFELDQKSVKKN